MPTVQELAERISWISESSTMKVAAEADRQRREGVDVVDFSAGEPDFPTPDNIKNAAIEALRQNFTKYTPVSGTMELKQTICDYHKGNYGTAYSPKECIATIGGKHAIFNLVQALVDPGDEVIIPVPYWVTYKDVVNFAAGKCVFVDTDEQEGFVLSAAQVERHLTPKTRMIILNSPSNPSGAVFDRAEMEKIFRLAKDRGIWVMTDECYERFLYDSELFSLASLPDAKDTVVVAGSLSKTYAMTGWRMGFVLGPAAVVAGINKLQSHTTSNPTSIVQKAAIEASRGPQESVAAMLAEYRVRRDYVIDRLRKIPGVKAQMPQGAFYAYPNVSAAFRKGITNSMEFSEKLLAEEHVAVVPGEAFGTADHIRLSYATSIKELERGLDRLERFIKARCKMAAQLTPRFLPKVWGSTHLEPWYRDSKEKIGEVWFESDPKPPLLIKFLFTTEPLSVQVHPEGKTEMWHILKAEPGAKIAAGFREPITEERLRVAALSGEIEQLLEWFEARPGDTFFIPAGTVHAIGAGLVLCEIQQHSDTTYRLFDYGRPRELHLDQGIPVSKLGPHAARQRAQEGVLVSCPFFTTEKLRIDGTAHCDAGRTVILLDGTLKIDGQPAVAGEAWYAGAHERPIEMTGQATILLTY